jgi:hypothetical protein
MATVTLTYHTRPPDGGTDRLLAVSTTTVVTLETVNLAAIAISRQYPRALPERASGSSWRIIDPSNLHVLATLVISD